ncbi:hypothetical protein JHK82_047866 [Glycine max]|nr:hypothetical protein JHK82_047866 [Glycine max]
MWPSAAAVELEPEGEEFCHGINKRGRRKHGKKDLCEKMKQHVRYNNVLDDDGVSYLEEAVSVLHLNHEEACREEECVFPRFG